MVSLIARLWWHTPPSATVCRWACPTATNSAGSKQLILEIATQHTAADPPDRDNLPAAIGLQATSNVNTDTDTSHNRDHIMSFSQWMSDLRAHQPQPTSESPVSVASSWADTDCESGSDSECGNYVFFGHNQTRKSVAMKRVYQRTAPISIPQSSQHHLRAHCSPQYEETPVENYSDEYSRDSIGAMDIDQDDLMLFGNLAYLRTQHGATASTGPIQRSAVTSTELAPSNEDEQIFEMEL